MNCPITERPELGAGKQEASSPVAWVCQDLPLLIPLLVGLASILFYRFTLFHALIEVFGITILTGCFLVAWNTRHISGNDYFLFLGIALLFMAVIETFHFLTYPEILVFNNSNSDLPVQLRLASRYIAAVSFLIAPLFFTRRFRPRIVISVYAIVTSLLLVSIYRRVFPVCHVNGTGSSTFKNISEILVLLIFAAGVLVLRRRATYLAHGAFSLLLVSVGCVAAAGICFIFYAGMYSVTNIAGHYLEVLALYFVYKALIETSLRRPYGFLFQQLKKSEDQYRMIVEEQMDLVCRFQPGGALTYVNDVYCRYFDVVREELIGKDYREVMPPPLRALIDEAIDANRRGVVFEREYSLDSPGGPEWFSAKVGPIILDGRYSGSVAVVRETTARHRAEEAVQENLRFLQTLIDTIPNPVAYKDLHGVYISCNTAYAEFLGMTKDRILRRNMLDVLPKDQATTLTGIEQELVRRTGRGVWESRLRHADGTDRDVLLYKAAYHRPDGAVEGVVTVVLDITRSKQAEAELAEYREHMHRAEQLASLGTLGAAFAHQINQPLTAIRLFLQQSLRALEKGSVTRLVPETLADALTEVAHAISITDHFLYLARQAPDEVRAIMDLHEVIARICAVLAPIARRKQVEVTVALAPEVGPIQANVCDVEQIFFILIQNAIQAAPETRASRVEVRGRRQGEMLEIQVADTCGGIAPEHQDRIFEPFFTTKPAGMGTGLGLPILQRIVTRCGGSVRLENMPGYGATFVVTAPFYV